MTGFTSAIYSRQMMRSRITSRSTKVIQLDEHRYWLYTAVDPKTNNILHIRLYSTTTTALTEWFLHELTEKHDLDNAVFLVDRVKHLQTTLRRTGLRFRYEKHGSRNAAERVFHEIKRRTSYRTTGTNHRHNTLNTDTMQWVSAIAVLAGLGLVVYPFMFETTEAAIWNDTLTCTAIFLPAGYNFVACRGTDWRTSASPR